MAAGERPHPFVPVLLAWLVPGAGHLRLGRPWPGLFVAAAILPLYVAGMALAGFENVSPERHPYYFLLHVFGGVPTAAAALLTRGVPDPGQMPHGSVGELYTAVACLLNAMAMADVWARCRRGDPEDAGREDGTGAEAGAEAAAPAASRPDSLLADEPPAAQGGD